MTSGTSREHATRSVLLKPRRLGIVGLGAASLAFVLIGVWMVREGEWFAWLCIGFFGLCLLVSLVLMLPNASYLELTAEGFTMCSLFRAHTIRWADVSAFAVGEVAGNRMVMFNFTDSYQRAPRLRTLSAGLTGFEGALPDSYGLRHEDLAELMNRFKAASAGGGAQTAAGSDLQSALWSGDTSSGFPWRLLLLKLAALLSFCGGPLVLADLLKVHVAGDLAFAVAFLPSVALIFGVYSLWRRRHDRWDDAMVLLGAVGAVALLAIDVFAVLELVTGPSRADAGLIAVGIVVGVAFVAFYGGAAVRYFRSPHTLP